MNHEVSLHEYRLNQRIRQTAGTGSHVYEDTEPPSDPLGAAREALAAVMLEIRQRRLKHVTDAALIANARRLVLLVERLEAEVKRRPPWWRRLWNWLCLYGWGMST